MRGAKCLHHEHGVLGVPGVTLCSSGTVKGLRHPACVIVCDIMCDSGRPPVRTRRGSADALAQTRAEGALHPKICVLPASKTPPRVSPSGGTRIGPPTAQSNLGELKGGGGAFQLTTSSRKPSGCLFQ